MAISPDISPFFDVYPFLLIFLLLGLPVAVVMMERHRQQIEQSPFYPRIYTVLFWVVWALSCCALCAVLWELHLDLTLVATAYGGVSLPMLFTLVTRYYQQTVWEQQVKQEKEHRLQERSRQHALWREIKNMKKSRQAGNTFLSPREQAALRRK